MQPIYANCCYGVSIGCVYGFFGALDNHGISWQKSHKNQTKHTFVLVLTGLRLRTNRIFCTFFIGLKRGLSLIRLTRSQHAPASRMANRWS